MNPELATAMAEVLKLGIIGWVTYMRTNGATAEQIDEAYQAAKAELFANDPARIPD